MNLFRNLLVWILLAIIGALAWHLLAQDPGYVLVRYRGWDYTTNLLWVSVAVVAGLFALWLLWSLVALPLRAWRNRQERQSRERLGSGLEALHQGHYARAEKLLPQAAADSDAAIARLEQLRAADWTRARTVARMLKNYDVRRRRLAQLDGEEAIDDEHEDLSEHTSARVRLTVEVIAAQRDAVVRLRQAGAISDDVMHRLERELDLEELRLQV